MSCSSIRRNIGIADGGGDYAGLNAAIRGIPQTDDFVRTANPSQAADRLRTADRFQTADHVQAPRSMGTNFGDGA